MPEMPKFEIDPSVSRRAFEAIESSFKPSGWASRMLDSLGQKGLLPGGSQNRIIDGTASLASTVGHNLGRFDTIATGASGKWGRDMWRQVWMEGKNQQAMINNHNASIGKQVPEHIVRNNAMRAANKAVSGPNNEAWVGFLRAVIKEHGPVYGPQKAAFLATNLQLMMGDQPYSPVKFSYDGDGNIKWEPEGRYETSDLFKNVMGHQDLYEALKGKYHPARPPSTLTKGMSQLTRWGHYSLAPAAALKHMAQVPGLLSNMTSFQNGYVTLGALHGTGRADAIALLHNNNAGAEMFTDIQADELRYKLGWYSKAKWLNPKVGRWLAQQGATPGLKGLRYRLIPAAGAQGNFVLHEAATILERYPNDVAAKINLKFLGLEPSEVMHEWYSNNRAFARDANGVSETIKTAINNNIEQRVFFNNPGLRSALALSPMGRIGTVYHWMGQNEKSWFQRELVRAYQSKNPVQIASLIATMGILYPGTHWIMAKLNEAWSGKTSPMQAAKEMVDPTEDAQMQAHILQTYVDMMGVGVEWSKINAAANHQLLEEGVGAHIKAGGNLIQDSTAGAVGIFEGEPHKAYPFYRDVLEDMPFHVGGWAAHTWFPTRKEIEAKKPMTSKRRAAQKAAEKRKYSQQ
jgi:hypothetical protein